VAEKSASDLLTLYQSEDKTEIAGYSAEAVYPHEGEGDDAMDSKSSQVSRRRRALGITRLAHGAN
jgi:hypothetical protein